jgi:hypothetical protein
MDAAFMSLEQHESGIHALRSGASGAEVTKVHSSVRIAAQAASMQKDIAFRTD